MKKISVSIFFPAYNEAENIAEAVERTVRAVEDSPRIQDYEIIVVNDGSSDATAEKAARLAELFPRVRVVNHESNKGYGAALKTGIASATKDYVFFTDADLQFDIVELEALLVHVPPYQFVVGYRAPRRDPLMRLLNAWGWNVLNRFFFGLKIRDIDCAFKLFRRELVQTMRLYSRGAMINAEILIRIQRKGIPIKQVPVSHLPRVAGSPTGAKPSVILRAFREMIGLYNGELGLVTQKQVLKFMTVGVLNTLVDLSAYVLLTRGFGTLLSGEPIVAKFFSFILGTMSSFMLNRAWTFGVTGRVNAAEVARFYTVASLALLINVSTMYVFTNVLHFYDLVALALATGITFAASFTLSKVWVFAERKVKPLRLTYYEN